MNGHKGVGAGRGVVGVGFILSLLACGGAGTDANDSPISARGSEVPTLARVGDAIGVSESPDSCGGTSATRVLARLSGDATCASMIRVLSGVVPDARAALQFSNAPVPVRDRFCVFSGAAEGAAAVPRLLTTLSESASVVLAIPDCSTDPLVVSSTDPGVFVVPHGRPGALAPAGHVVDEVSDPGDKGDGGTVMTTEGTHSCDACAVALDDTLFVNLPPTMTATTDTNMLVQFADTTLPARQIVAPAGAQSFTVPGLDVPDSTTIRITATGVTASP